jgi:nucleoside-diphosphate-sugar epimerase
MNQCIRINKGSHKDEENISLVTGGSGFIGSEIVKQLYESGEWEITHGADWKQSYLYKQIEGECYFINGSVCDLEVV